MYSHFALSLDKLCVCWFVKNYATEIMQLFRYLEFDILQMRYADFGTQERSKSE